MAHEPIAETGNNVVIPSLKSAHEADINDLLEGEGNVRPELEEQRLQHNRDMHDREKNLFSYSLRAIKCLFIFAMIIICAVLAAVTFGEVSPWICLMGTATLLIPTLLLACMLYHVYTPGNADSAWNALKVLLKNNPVSEVLGTIFKVKEELK